MSRDKLQQVKEEIRMRLDIVSFIERYVKLKPAGTNYKGLCPFHKEKSPSFMVNSEKEIYHCFGCGKGGDIFSFIMEIEGVDFVEALKFAAKEVGVELENSPPPKHYNGTTISRETAFTANTYAMNFFYTMMRQSEEAIAYFKERGIAPEIVRDFRLGFAPDGWTALIDSASSQGFVPQILVASGLAIASAKGGRVYDRFRKRIMFPIFDMAGRPVAFGGRIIDPEDNPKYLNSPETLLYQKNKVFYGLYQSRQDIKLLNCAIVVEGYMDLLALFQNDIRNVVASCGTALTREHGFYLRRFTDKVILLFDGDDAGVQAARRAVENLFPLELDVRVVILPTGEDPDSLIQKEGTEAFREILDGAVLAIDFYISLLLEHIDVSTPQGKSKIVTRLAHLIATVEDRVIRSDYATMVSSRFSVDEALFRDLMNKNSKQDSQGFTHVDEAKEQRYQELLNTEEGRLIHLLVSDKEELEKWLPKISIEIFCEPLLTKLYSFILRQEGKLDSGIEGNIDSSLRDLISLMMIQEIVEENISEAIAKKVSKLETTRVERRKKEITRELALTTDISRKMALLEEQKQLIAQNRQES